MPCREVSFLRTANKKLQEQAALKGQKRGRNTEPFHRRILRDIDKGAEIRSQTVKNVQSSLLSGWEGKDGAMPHTWPEFSSSHSVLLHLLLLLLILLITIIIILRNQKGPPFSSPPTTAAPASTLARTVSCHQR